VGWSAVSLALFVLEGCGPTKVQQLAECKISNEGLPGMLEIQDHLDKCMSAAGYSLVEAKVGQTARSDTERIYFADWGQARFMQECYTR
jgi:hypothetical protein